MNILDVSNLSVSFPTKYGTVEAVRDASFSIKEGELVGIIGESGSGKSVIGASIIQILPAYAKLKGSIKFKGLEICGLKGEEIRKIRGKQISFIPQSPSNSLNPLLTNGFQIDEISIRQGITKETARKRTLESLKYFLFPNPEKIVDQYVHQISGGMQERIVTAISSLEDPSLIIADEPTKGLDDKIRNISRDLFRKIVDEKKTAMLLITHDIELAEEICDSVLVMYAGEFVETGRARDVFNNPIHPYTIGLMNARPKNGLIPMEGDNPDLMDLPNGCFFQDRCLFCYEQCIKNHPQLTITDKRGVRCHRL